MDFAASSINPMQQKVHHNNNEELAIHFSDINVNENYIVLQELFSADFYSFHACPQQSRPETEVSLCSQEAIIYSTSPKNKN